MAVTGEGREVLVSSENLYFVWSLAVDYSGQMLVWPSLYGRGLVAVNMNGSENTLSVTKGIYRAPNAISILNDTIFWAEDSLLYSVNKNTPKIIELIANLGSAGRRKASTRRGTGVVVVHPQLQPPGTHF